MQIRGYKQFGGKHHETAALRNVLAHWGVIAPHTGQPFSEELIFGIGGGIASVHFCFNIAHQPYFVPLWRSMSDFAIIMAQKLNLTTHMSESSGTKTPLIALREFIDGGDPVIVWGDMASMPYHALTADMARYFRHVFVVYGYDMDEDKVMVADRSCVPLTISLAELAATRRKIMGYKQRLLVVEPPDEVEGLEQAVLEGMRSVCQHMLEKRGSRSGLHGLDTWAKVLIGKRNKQDWHQLFSDRALLFDALCSVYYFGEIRGTGGGAYRQMYAGFLDEAAIITNKPSLHDVAELYRECAKAWQELNEAALPDDIEPYGEARALIKRRAVLYEQQGQAAQAEMTGITDRLWAIRSELGATFQPRQAEVDTLLANLREHVLSVRAAESEAVNLLRLLVGF